MREVLIGRSIREFSKLVNLIEEWGRVAGISIRVFSLPLLGTAVLRMEEGNFLGALREGIRRGDSIILVFSSMRAVERVAEIIGGTELGERVYGGVRCLTIGVGTGDACVRAGFKRVEVVLGSYQEGLLKRALGLAGSYFLIPRAEEVRPYLEGEFKKRKIRHRSFVVYRTFFLLPGENLLKRLQDRGRAPGYIALTSSSMIKALGDALRHYNMELELPYSTSIAIGRSTWETFRESGFRGRLVLSREANFRGLVEMLREK